MRKKSWVKWMSCLALVAAPSPGSAQDHIDVSVLAGPAVFLNDLADPARTDGLRNDDAVAFGARIALGGERFGVEATAAAIPTEVILGPGESNRFDQSIVALSVEGIAAIPGDVVEPFVAVGLGDKHYRNSGPERGGSRGFNASTYLMVSAGAGVRLHLAEAFHVRLDVRDLISQFNTFERGGARAIPWTQHDLLITLGGGYRFKLN